MRARWKLLTLAAALGIVMCLIFLAVRPISASPDVLVLKETEMPEGWRTVDTMDRAAPETGGGEFFGRIYGNDSVDTGKRLHIILHRYGSTSEAITQFSVVVRGSCEPSDRTCALGDRSKVNYGTIAIQDANGKHFGDATTTYLVVVGNVLIEMRFITAGPFTEEKEFRTVWMDDLVVAQYDKVREYGPLF